MEENKKILNDDDIEILDFDDDIPQEINIDDEIEIIDLEDETPIEIAPENINNTIEINIKKGRPILEESIKTRNFILINSKS